MLSSYGVQEKILCLYNRLNINQLKKRLYEMDRDDSFSAKVRSALIELLPGGMSTGGRGWWYYSDKSSKDLINQRFLADLVLQKNAFGEVFTGGAVPFSTANMNLLH